ncbi:inactive C-alpha-formylglycine-generating enzyme 2 isoform X3 [Phyllopteryx taeniolatus]|uniref:inactive C-alpha-formylglycine-generating enzyme 2 isoform X3 n=1 Tax=Phyllopteryx taeniolatus TaxID=161469 RepID=UPI002AD400A9|nr:inactive C-alpha-formylglycine-generating enzyme 2 isoform X3 [Phyllopteryx taeniolatus]
MLFRCLWCVGLLSVITAAAAEENDGMVAIPGGRMTTTTTRSYGRAEDEETEIQLLPFLLDKQPVTNSAFRDFVRDQKYKTEAETFGWSFVFQDFVSEDIKGKVTHTIKSAPWWLPVERAFWRQVCSSVLFFFLFFSELGFRPSAHVAHTQPAGAGSGIAARLDFPVVQARRFPGGSASGPIGATCGRARFRTATRRRTDITASLPSTPSRRRTTSVRRDADDGDDENDDDVACVQDCGTCWATRGSGRPACFRRRGAHVSKCSRCAAPPGSTRPTARPITERKSPPGWATLPTLLRTT